MDPSSLHNYSNGNSSVGGISAPSNQAAMANGQPQNESSATTLNQDSYLARIDNTMVAMQEQNLAGDPRYAQLATLRDRIASSEGGSLTADEELTMAEHGGDPADDGADVKVELDDHNLNWLRAQIAAYKMLARNEPVPRQLLNQATGRRGDGTLLPLPYEYPLDLGNGEKLPYDLTRILNLHQQRSTTRTTSLPIPLGIDPQVILRERENRIQNRIGQRINELMNMPLSMPPHLRIQAEIELRSLRLLNLQTQVRSEVLSYLKRDTSLETALNPYAYRRTKRYTLREARVTERLEKQQKVEQERRRRLKHQELLAAIMQASRDFKDFHRNVQVKQSRVRKAIVTYHANSERERKKDELRNEKMRMMKLMEEDEVGYRQLLDEKKDKRLVYLLQQTDEYVESLTGLVKQHQQSEKKRKLEERREAKRALEQQTEGEGVTIVVRNCATGEILKGDDLPNADELEAWMDANPGYEVISRDAASDSEEEEAEVEEPNEVAVEEPVRQASEEKKEDEFEGLDEEQRNKRIIEKARNEEDEYDHKSKQQMESYYATAHQIKEKVMKQHSSLGASDSNLQLKPYQIKGLEWLVSLYNNNLNGILADEMGLGKTIQTVALITYLMEVKKINGPYLIIVPLSTISNWKLEMDKWSPHVVKIIYKGDKDARKRMELTIKKGAFNVLLTTYDYVLKERAILGKIRWKYMIIDEGHRMKNHNCKLTLTLNAYFSAQHRLLLTGTPLQNKLPELWALLNFLLPSIFSSCGTFEQWFNAPFSTTPAEKVELNQEETMLIIRRLHKVLRPFLLRRLKKEVESQLPDKTEYVIKCDMSALQRIIYKHLQKGLLIDSKHQAGRALMNTVVHLRKLCNHPFLFPTVEDECRNHWRVKDITGKELYRVAGKFELLDRMLPKLKATGHRILIFCQMTMLLNIMEDYFHYREWKYMRLDGSTKHEDRGSLLAAFNAPDSDYFIFILSTRAGGLGLNLQAADTVVLFDSDWNPHQDMQAQDRAHRIGQTREVRVLRLITVNSVEEKILAAARFKLNVDEKVIQAGKFDQRSTGAERRKMLEELIKAENDEDDEDEVPDDEVINQMIARSEEEFEIFQKMDIERRRQEATEYRRKPRLIEENEIPQSIIDQSKRFTEDEEKALAAAMASSSSSGPLVESLTDSGRRKRKDVNYSADLMSEREWLKSIDEAFDDSGGEEEEDEQPKRKRAKKGAADAGGAEPKPRGRRGRKRAAVIEDNEESDGGEDADQQSTSAKKQRIGEGVFGVDPKLADRFNTLLCTLINYKTSNGKELAYPFIQLPSRREMPDYYEVIERPMDLNRIKKKVRDGRYGSLREITDDIDLLCKNAQTYNTDESEIYQDSLLLEAVWKRLVEMDKMREKESATPAAPNEPSTSGSAQALPISNPLRTSSPTSAATPAATPSAPSKNDEEVAGREEVDEEQEQEM